MDIQQQIEQLKQQLEALQGQVEQKKQRKLPNPNLFQHSVAASKYQSAYRMARQNCEEICDAFGLYFFMRENASIEGTPYIATAVFQKDPSREKNLIQMMRYCRPIYLSLIPKGDDHEAIIERVKEESVGLHFFLQHHGWMFKKFSKEFDFMPEDFKEFVVNPKSTLEKLFV